MEIERMALLMAHVLSVWIDTAFDLGQIASRPKLMAKLLVLTVLSINGCLLHHHFFDLSPACKHACAFTRGAGSVAWQGPLS